MVTKARETLEGITMEEARLLIAANRGLQLDQLAEYLASFAQVVSKGNEEASVLYPASGADIYTPLHIANPAKVVMTDRVAVDSDVLKGLPVIRGLESGELLFYNGRKELEYYLKEIFPRGFSMLGELAGNLYPFAIAQLFLAGVNPENVRFERRGNAAMLSFDWKHPSENMARERRVTFDCSDYMEAFYRHASAAGYDVLLSKAGMLPAEDAIRTAGILREGGFLVTDAQMPMDIGSQLSYAKVELPSEIPERYEAVRNRGYMFGYGNQYHGAVFRLEKAKES